MQNYAVEMSSKIIKPQTVKKVNQKTLDQLFSKNVRFSVQKEQMKQLTGEGNTVKQSDASDAFDKEKWTNTLSGEEKVLLESELKNINDKWLPIVYRELTKPYFKQLKQFLITESKTKTIFPEEKNIYSFSNYCPELSKIKVLILGQDPYHNYKQAHGLAFSVLCEVLPPSLKNIYKCVNIDYPEIGIPKKNGNLGPWCEQGVLLLNTCLTVEAHKANSHNNKGWETFTSAIIKNLIDYKNKQLDQEVIILAWGSFAMNLVKKTINLDAINKKNGKKNMVLTSVHPSPLSASRGFFTCQHFKKANEWLKNAYGEEIDWSIAGEKK